MMWTTSFILHVGCFAPSIFAATPIVDLTYAQYQGFPNVDPVDNETTTQFLGIRYAAAPNGEPQLPSYTPGVQLANRPPSECFQAGEGVAPENPFRKPIADTSPTRRFEIRVDSGVSGASEDCLFPNVYVPGRLGEKQNLSVLVWIHGGGYVAGNATEFNGNDLIREAGGGFVTVIIQHRLGLFGFLPGAKVKKSGALNAGLLDQQAAFQWVLKYISKFGGDPDKVTIWGGSAGAGSVLQHIVAKSTKTSHQGLRSFLLVTGSQVSTPL